ncbi:NepR family anti-sigma factor [Sphingobium sp. H39-3-25]|uniref:NepR family anti-sigma factor n=1 Tax=Sphingobium arseniciresistens TaxID=3030834 RepID=UPI0023B972FB|nr:NepR family anti-sigma factor [Sphingobium arseniciresistens]
MSSTDMSAGKKAEASADGSGATAPAAKASAGKTSRKKGVDGDVGNVLRSAYQQTIDEAIPPEMLDLLSKLD